MYNLPAGDDAEEVVELVGNAGAASAGVEYGEVEVGVGVGGEVEAAPACGPEAQDPVDVEEVCEEGAPTARSGQGWLQCSRQCSGRAGRRG